MVGRHTQSWTSPLQAPSHSRARLGCGQLEAFQLKYVGPSTTSSSGQPSVALCEQARHQKPQQPPLKSPGCLASYALIGLVLNGLWFRSCMHLVRSSDIPTPTHSAVQKARTLRSPPPTDAFVSPTERIRQNVR